MARIPKNYQGTRLTVRKLGPILSKLVEGLSPKEMSGLPGLQEIWPMIIGPEMARMTKVVRFSQGVVFVEVKSATLYALLSRREKPRILEAIKKQMPKMFIQDICFGLGR